VKKAEGALSAQLASLELGSIKVVRDELKKISEKRSQMEMELIQLKRTAIKLKSKARRIYRKKYRLAVKNGYKGLIAVLKKQNIKVKILLRTIRKTRFLESMKGYIADLQLAIGTMNSAKRAATPKASSPRPSFGSLGVLRMPKRKFRGLERFGYKSKPRPRPTRSKQNGLQEIGYKSREKAKAYGIKQSNFVHNLLKGNSLGGIKNKYFYRFKIFVDYYSKEDVRVKVVVSSNPPAGKKALEKYKLQELGRDIASLIKKSKVGLTTKALLPKPGKRYVIELKITAKADNRIGGY
jgi:hypothetical protein